MKLLLQEYGMYLLSASGAIVIWLLLVQLLQEDGAIIYLKVIEQMVKR